ncbi:MAG: dihydroorotate dehydrogenase electron transfer subunit [Candidatus Omnitrophota bacterium]
MKDIKTKIISNEIVAPGYYKMVLEAPYITKTAIPGQFIQVRCSDSYEPLLRRPFGIHRITNHESRITILYEVVGKGTTILSKRRKGERLDVLGPLGNGFTLQDTRHKTQDTRILIAGGVGIAPLTFVAEALVKKKIKPIVLIGAKTKKAIVCSDDLKKMGLKVHIATDDGTLGHKGFVTDLFRDLLPVACGLQPVTVYSCGPKLMLKKVSEICKKEKINCQVSLEETFGCGIGACLGCSCKIKDRRNKFTYKLTCKDGPIFKGEEVIWE